MVYNTLILPWLFTLIPDLTMRSDLLLLLSDLLHTDINTILNTDTWSNICWYLIYYMLTSTWFLTVISYLTLSISHLTLRSDLLMLISDLLLTDINMILNTDISSDICLYQFTTHWYEHDLTYVYMWSTHWDKCDSQTLISHLTLWYLI